MYRVQNAQGNLLIGVAFYFILISRKEGMFMKIAIAILLIGGCVALIAWNVVDIVKSVLKRRKEKNQAQSQEDKKVQEK